MRNRWHQVAYSAAMMALVLAALSWIKLHNYLLFHSLAELFSILIATSIFVVAWNARRFHHDNYLTFLGIAFLFVGGFDLLHTLAYRGMGVFKSQGANLATQLWIAARCLQSLSFLAAPLLIGRKVHPLPVLAGMAAVFSLTLLMIFRWRVFPDCFVEPAGLTAFKRISEYVICILLLAGLGAWIWRGRGIEPGVRRLVLAALGVTVAQELAFTLYTDPYALPNFVGHCLKIVSYYLVYKALVEIALTRPYDLLFFDLARKERELARSNADLEQFAAVVSHDLRSPLMSADGFVELLRRRHGEQLGPEGRELLDYGREGLARMKLLITTLLEYARVGKGEISPAPCSADTALHTALRALKTVLDGAGAEVTCDPLPVVRADEPLLSQVFQNLIENAVKYRSQRPPRIHVAAGEREREHWFAIADNGIGIAPEHRERIFKAFQRIQADDSPEAGLGIGLATCKRIIELHGGRIWVESAPGEGSRFCFTLPR